jgi:hypothetical protein
MPAGERSPTRFRWDLDTGVDQVRLAARARLADVFAGLIGEGVAAGEFAPQDARLRGAAIVGALLEALVAPLARRTEVPPDRDAITREVAAFCRAAVAGAGAGSPHPGSGSPHPGPWEGNP